MLIDVLLFVPFSNKLHFIGKWIQFDLIGGPGVMWKHNHLLAGLGGRSYINDKKNQWQIDFLSGISDISGNKGYGSVKNLVSPLFINLKYLYVFGGNFMVGPQVTFGRVPSKCTDPNGTYLECGHGGYSSISVAVQIGIPKEWGQ